MHKPLALALALALALPASAAEPAESHAKAVAPFLDEQTLAVARLDLTKVDAPGLLDILGALGQNEPDEVKDPKASIDRWLAAFAKAGGKELYLVLSLADFPGAPFAIVPLAEGADARAIAGLLDLPLLPAGPREKLGGAVFAGSRAALERLRSLKPVSRPELAKAFAAAGDGAAQVALAPPPSLVRAFNEMMPVLPKEVGGGSGKMVTRGLRWAALGLDAPPKMALRVTIQSDDASSAKALKDLHDRALKALAEEKEVRAALPDFDQMAALLAPKVEGDRLVLSLDDRQTHAVVTPLVRRAVLAAARVATTERLKRLALGLHLYADANNKLPPVANFSQDGKPLLSWRVHLLPYLGEEKLYKEFHPDEPWDGEHNKQLIARMPAVFRGPSLRLNDQGKTVFLVPVGKAVAFSGGADGRRFPHDFPDGTSNTIFIVEADAAHAVEWTRPEDLKIDPAKPNAGLARPLGSFLFALADGSVRSVKATVSKETLWAAFTRDGGEVLGKDW